MAKECPAIEFIPDGIYILRIECGDWIVVRFVDGFETERVLQRDADRHIKEGGDPADMAKAALKGGDLIGNSLTGPIVEAVLGDSSELRPLIVEVAR